MTNADLEKTYQGQSLAQAESRINAINEERQRIVKDGSQAFLWG